MVINPYYQSSLTKALQCLQTLAERGQCWLCGGSVRDMLLARFSADIDVVVPLKAIELAQMASSRLKCKLVVMNEDILPTARLVLPEGQIDITQWRAPNLPEDLLARDFTINAMVLPLSAVLEKPFLSSHDFIDPANGMDALANKELRLPRENALQEDPLRILRAYRMHAQLGFALADGINKALPQAIPLLRRVAGPRLEQEWIRIMQTGKASLALYAMDQSGVLSFLIPQWEAGRNMEQNPFHHLPVLEHNLAALQAVENILNEPDAFLPHHLAHLTPETPPALLKTACLLHDLGKPATRAFKQPGWYSFHNHDQKGIELAYTACAALGMGNNQASTVALLVGKHMLPQHLQSAALRHPALRRRMLGRFLHRHGGLLHSLMFMGLADIMAGRGKASPPGLKDGFIELWSDLAEIQAAPIPPRPLLNGRELMTTYGLKPGPELGGILNRLRQRQMEGSLRTKDEAHLLVRQWLGCD